VNQKQEEIMLRKMLMAFVMTVFSSTTFGDDATSGKFAVEGFFAGTANFLDAGNGNLTVTYDGVMGVKAIDGTTFGDMSSWHCAGSLTAFSGKFDNEIGICKIQFADGDTAFMTYVGSGALGKPASGTGHFIGGTGKYENISGELTFNRQSLNSAKDGYVQAYNTNSGTYSLN